MIYALDKRMVFPDPRLGEPDGLLAVGGDLSVDRLILAYSHGIFPWYDFRRGQIQWWCPMQRFVIFPQEVHVSHSMRQLLKTGRYRVTFNKAFERVIHHCGQLRIEMEGAWLGPEMTEAYTRLYAQDMAASVEVWEGDELVGGLYGVTLGRIFFGESMFSLAPSASKVALVELCRLFGQHGGLLVDCQFHTPHLESMGGRFIPYEEYIRILRQ